MHDYPEADRYEGLAVKTDTRSSPFVENSAILRARLDELDGLLDRLSERLEPVLLPGGDERAATPSDPMRAGSDHTGTICQATSRIAMLSCRVAELTDRIDA